MQSIDSVNRGFTGTISLGLTELIQMVCLSRSDLVIGVTSAKGKASIHIRQGQIQHAQSEELTGAEAFFEVARWNDGQFEILPYENNVPNSVNKPWEHLLLEAIRQQDEKAIESAQEESSSDIFGQTVHNPGPDILADIDDILGDLFGRESPADLLTEENVIASEEPRASVKVLLVDDSTFFSKRLQEMLEAEGTIEVAGVAHNGKEALELLGAGTPVDLITLDVNMPVMPGDTALKHIMIQYHIPVIIISSQQPDSMHKIFNFLQLGAVDFVAKPGIHDDPFSYGANLRKLVKGVAKARISNFIRLRTPNYSGESISPKPEGETRRKTLVIVGAEGAYMDWLRLPLRQLCAEGLVLGIQKLEKGIVSEFARFITDKTGVETEYLSAFHRITPGKFYLSDARRKVGFRLGPNLQLDVGVSGSTVLEWETGLELWLQHLAAQLGHSMCVYYMSAADPAPESLLTSLLEHGVKHILAPVQSVVCSGLVDSVEPYAAHFPGLVLHSNPDSLTEVLKT